MFEVFLNVIDQKTWGSQVTNTINYVNKSSQILMKDMCDYNYFDLQYISISGDYFHN